MLTIKTIRKDFNIFFFKLLGIIGKLLISEKIKLQFIIYIVVDLFIPFKTFIYQFRNLRKFFFFKCFIRKKKNLLNFLLHLESEKEISKFKYLKLYLFFKNMF